MTRRSQMKHKTYMESLKDRQQQIVTARKGRINHFKAKLREWQLENLRSGR